MGRIKSALIKRTSHQLLKEDNDFTDSFDYNKKLLKDTMPSKKTRNKIAGYLARLKKAETKKHEKDASPTQPKPEER
ncbi:30S ribosomal protein S17e [Candidatus Pacearchaeota archaeon CG10_big_fil_rev_8_21_14_0_10_35_219]|nr:30S ribosomal protein S17e [Candidatus Pacearchaeota archaeon]OIO41848.1 MAG: hypothetical protein AUJ63_04800 [Candidatus Pacearchaeota archaeon CG1_02_35_32]PIO08479.1 MAG: 30S ribosomal protein S17e [Candidatus Pacearchaeota archaeon CG10_big_fil_rev_8_21_14_0_10_35_219]PIY81624.1 MAG: 30S ribosomal protein S17e [Candidatus Pacearchaeota archaeon CG_4_10_14_0_8_um_filter_35_169]PIZ80102.1 MAG: 30S ribosomal protein S17e [Candidatus Pacearchaeota archaeon CG_4_10_14_0_2_um_filter_35_33]PJ